MYIISAFINYLNLGELAERFTGGTDTGGVGGLVKRELIKSLKSPDSDLISKALPMLFGLFSDGINTMVTDYLKAGGWGILTRGIELRANEADGGFKLIIKIDENIDYGKLLKKTIAITSDKLGEKHEFVGSLVGHIGKLSESEINSIMSTPDDGWKYGLLKLLSDEYRVQIIDMINNMLAKNDFAVTVGSFTFDKSELLQSI